MTFHYGHLTATVVNGRAIADGCKCDLGPAENPDASKREDKPKQEKSKSWWAGKAGSK